MRYLSLLQALLTRRVPVYVHYGVTHRCNLTCRMCGMWKIADKAHELTLPQIQQMARNLHRLGTCAISLGGGEPFLRQDLPEIIRAFQEQDIEPRVLTNGLIQDHALLQRVLDTGIRHVSISLDTPRASLQDNICNKEGAWEKIISAIRFWGEALRARRGLGVLNCVVSKLNYKELEYVVAIAKEYGFRVSFVPVELHKYQERDLGCANTTTDMPIHVDEHEELAGVHSRLLELRSRRRSNIFNSTPYLQGMLPYLKGEACSLRCLAGSLSFSVSPEGYYSMCHLHKGNGQHGEEHISAASKDFVAWYRQNRPYRAASRVAAQCQSCYRPCWREIALAFTNVQAFWQAFQMRKPDRIPSDLPTPEELCQRLGLPWPTTEPTEKK